jgi:hypothetical protein
LQEPEKLFVYSYVSFSIRGNKLERLQ